MKTTLGKLRALLREAIVSKAEDETVVIIDAADVDICLENQSGSGKQLGGEDDKFVYVPYSVPKSLASDKLLKHPAAERAKSLLGHVRNGGLQVTPFDIITAAKKGKWLSDSGVTVVRGDESVLKHLVDKCAKLIAAKFAKEKVNVVYDVDSGTSTMSRDLARRVGALLNVPVVSGDEGGLKKASKEGDIVVNYDKVEEEYADKTPAEQNRVFDLIDKAEKKINALLAAGKKVSISTDVSPASIRRYFRGMQKIADADKLSQFKHVLVIDDNVDQNVTMKDIRQHMSEVAPGAKLSFAAGVKLPSDKKAPKKS